jgi:hypothetical protein
VDRGGGLRGQDRTTRFRGLSPTTTRWAGPGAGSPPRSTPWSTTGCGRWRCGSPPVRPVTTRSWFRCSTTGPSRGQRAAAGAGSGCWPTRPTRTPRPATSCGAAGSDTPSPNAVTSANTEPPGDPEVAAHPASTPHAMPNATPSNAGSADSSSGAVSLLATTSTPSCSSAASSGRDSAVPPMRFRRHALGAPSAASDGPGKESRWLARC